MRAQSVPFGFGRINQICGRMRQFSLRQPFTPFSQQSCTNYTEGNCEFCVRACFFLSFECVHARSRDQSLHLLFFCCHIKSDWLHRLSSLCFSFTQPLPEFSQRNLPRVKVHHILQPQTQILQCFESASHNSPKHPPSRYTSSAEPTLLLPFPCFQLTTSAI